MYIIEVIPLTILPSNMPQLLSYFFEEKLEKGTLVEINIGHRKVKATVVSSSPIEDRKTSLKKSGFQLKKISNVIAGAPLVSEKQFKIALWISKKYYAPLGYCLKTVLPEFFLKKTHLKIKVAKTSSLNNLEEKPLNKPTLVLSKAKETLINLLPLIKKSAKNSGQIAFIVPDSSTVGHFHKTLEKNLDTAIISSTLKNKSLIETWVKISSGKTRIVLGTRQALFSPFKNLRLIVVDDCLHGFYKPDMTPKYNTPDLAMMISKLYNSKIVFTSNMSGTENYFKTKNNIYEFVNKTKQKGKLKILDMTEEFKKDNFSLFGSEFKNQIILQANQANQNKKILIFSPRRGHSGIILCQDCGHSVKCKDCGVPFRVHKNTEFIIICHHCSRSLEIPKNCPNCKSFKLKTAGPAGTQKIYDELRKIFETNGLTKIPILILDSDTTKNEAEEEEILNELRSSRTSVLIATQMIFSHRYDFSFDLIGVLNADSLTNTPDFRAEERLLYQLEKIMDFQPFSSKNEPKEIFVQTHHPENEVFLTMNNENYKQFYTKDIEARKAFYYPPFSRLIKLSLGNKNRNKAFYEARVLNNNLKMAIGQLSLGQKVKPTDSFPSFAEKNQGFFVYNIILKISPEFENIRDILKFVPSNWSIDVDPRSTI